MEKRVSIIKASWAWVSNLATAQWLWGLIPAGIGGGMTAWLAHTAQQQGWIILLAFFAVAALIVNIWTRTAESRARHKREARFKEMRAAFFDVEMARLEAAEDAKSAVAMKRLVGGIGTGLSDHMEEQEARREGRLARLRRGEEE